VFLKSSSALNTPNTKISTEFLYEKRQNGTHHYKKGSAIVKEFQFIAKLSCEMTHPAGPFSVKGLTLLCVSENTP
jgi:hypothetical protein